MVDFKFFFNLNFLILAKYKKYSNYLNWNDVQFTFHIKDSKGIS